MGKSFFDKLEKANSERNSYSVKIKDLEMDVPYKIKSVKKVKYQQSWTTMLTIRHPSTGKFFSVFVGEEYNDAFDDEIIAHITSGNLHGVLVFTGMAGQKQLYHLTFIDPLAVKRTEGAVELDGNAMFH